uniref:Exonuclease domain-containing protein n=1 Tax=Bracon brevicornis TaxID=1563983 RepID=A0A6V7LJJ6_9HYME
MAMKMIMSRAATIMQKKQELMQPFKYLLVMDFEATCEKDIPINQPEIIEFPCLAVNTGNWEVESIFHRYVKPKVNPILTNFCTDLTGIMQETIDDESHFPDVFDEFQHWFEWNGYNEEEKKSAFVTCGDWDLKVMLPSQCAIDNIPIPHYLKKWINLKTSYCDATQHYPRSLRDMLTRLNITAEGRMHSGLHDSTNMVKILETLAKKHNAVFNINGSN